MTENLENFENRDGNALNDEEQFELKLRPAKFEEYIGQKRVKDNKIWIEVDLTENGIATDLINEGVPTKNIVLAFHEPAMRQYTEFAPV